MSKRAVITIINIYDAITTDFNNNGTVLHQCISCVSTKELNKLTSLELVYPLDARGKFLNLKGLNIIKAGGQLYRIPLQNNIQAQGNSVKATANHIFFDLNNDFNEDTRAENKSVADALAIAIAVNPKFTVGECDDLGLNTAYFIAESPTQSIYNKILDRWGGELLCDNYNLSIKSKIGTNTGILIKYGKNIQGFEQTLDWSNLATKIIPKGKDGLVIDLVNGGNSFLISPRVNDYPFVITKEVKFENIEDATELKNACLALWGIVDLPSVNYKVVFADLAKTIEYKDFKDMLTLNLGDSVLVRHKIFKCDLTARVIKIVKNEITNTIISLELGQFKENISNKFSSINKQMAFNESNIIEAKADLTDAKTTIFQNTEQINLRATKANLIAEINVSAEAIKISAALLDLVGYATFTSLSTAGQTVINGSNITSGTISGDLIKGGVIEGATIKQVDGETVLAQFSKNTNGGTLDINDINGNANVQIGSEGAVGDNSGGSILIFNDGYDKQRAAISTLKSQDSGFMTLRDTNSKIRTYLTATGDVNIKAGLYLYDTAGVMKAHIDETSASINNQVLATCQWVIDNFVAK